MNIDWRGRMKSAVLPNGAETRRIPFGVAAGVRMQIDFGHQLKMYCGLYEIELNRHLRRFCRHGYDSFDVGGQFGYDALMLAKLTGGRVISFECDADTAAQMQENLTANPVHDGRIEARCRFVSAHDDPGRGHGTLDTAAFSSDGFIPDVIKIDIEGGEYDALLGATRLLSERRPHLIVETHSAELERRCDAYLRSFGYLPNVVRQRWWLKDHRPIEHNQWLVAAGMERGASRATQRDDSLRTPHASARRGE